LRQRSKWIWPLHEVKFSPIKEETNPIRRPRRNHSPAFNAKVALSALESDDNLTQLAERVAALMEALAHFGPPRDLQYESGFAIHESGFAIHQRKLPRAVRERHIRISMGGTGCWRDNVFVERFCRSVKYDEIYLHAYEVGDAYITLRAATRSLVSNRTGGCNDSEPLRRFGTRGAGFAPVTLSGR